MNQAWMALLRGKPGRWSAGAAHLCYRPCRAESAKLVRAAGDSGLCLDAFCRAGYQRQRRVGNSVHRSVVGLHYANAAGPLARCRRDAGRPDGRASTADLSRRGYVV